jgi:hypothetical protein
MFTSNHNSSYKRSRSCCSFAMALLIAVVVALGGSFAPARAASTQTPWQNLTPSKMTAVWWQWLFSVPYEESPVYDGDATTPGGAKAYNGQPYSDLLFLAGTFGIQELQNGDVLGKVTRSITVKKGTAFFFPLINTEWDNVCNRPNLGGNCFGQDKFPHNLGVPKLQALAAVNVDSTTGLYTKLTQTDQTFENFIGSPQNIIYPRLKSPPFSYKLPTTDNLLQASGIEASGTVAPAVADGYYSSVPGILAPGYYKLEFGGSFPITDAQGYPHTFSEAITYKITVTE